MQTAIKLIILTVFYFTITEADNVRLRNGQILKNCFVIDTIGTHVKVKTSEGERLFPITTIDEVVKAVFDSSQATYVVDTDGSIKSLKPIEQPFKSEIQTKNELIYVSEKAYVYPNTVLIPVSVIAFGLAWDYFSDVSSLNKQIDNYNKLSDVFKTLNPNVKFDTSEMESARTRKTILGITFVVAGVVNTVFAFKKVEVSATGNSVGLSYKF